MRSHNFPFIQLHVSSCRNDYSLVTSLMRNMDAHKCARITLKKSVGRPSRGSVLYGPEKLSFIMRVCEEGPQSRAQREP